MAEKISCDDLSALLMRNLGGTALQPIAKNKGYKTGSDGFVSTETIDRLCGVFEKTINFIKTHGSRMARRMKKREISKIRLAITSMRPYGSNP